MKRALARALCLLFALAVWCTAVPSSGVAQDADKSSARARRAARSKAKKKLVREPQVDAPVERERASKKKRRSREKVAMRGESVASSGTRPSTSSGAREKAEVGPSAAAASAQAAASGVNAQIVKEGDTSVKVMEFTGLGIEGRLKSPQLLYFVQRVRAEFERPLLPHRSFMPELEASTGREPVR